jgi:hypothetical protein
MMASQTIAQTLRIHGDFIKEIYDAVGDQPFTAGASRRSGSISLRASV